MKILPYSNNVNSYNQSQTRPNFKAHYDLGQVKELAGDGFIYKSGNIHNYSCLVRDLELFLKLPEMIKKKFPDGVKIYDYACSAGYESTTIDLGLHNSMSSEMVKKYTPIIARDNNPHIIKKAQEYRLRFEDDEMARLDMFENINKEDFFTPRRKDAYGQKIHDCKDILKKEIIYENGDLFKDLENGKLSDEPCIVLLRNTWQYMTPLGIINNVNLLSKHLQPKSIVVLGTFDVRTNAAKQLLKSGFKPVEDEYDVALKDKKLLAQYKDVSSFSPSKISTHCFEKV